MRLPGMGQWNQTKQRARVLVSPPFTTPLVVLRWFWLCGEVAPAGGSLKEPPGGGWGESPRPGGKTGGALKAPPGLRPGRGRCGDRRERGPPTTQLVGPLVAYL